MNTFCRFERVAARAFCSTVIAGALLAVAPGIAAAAGLFDNPTQADLRAAGPGKAEGAKRERLVRLNLAELARIVPVGADRAANRAERAKKLSGTVAIELFPGFTVQAQRTDIETPDEGGYVWLGKGSNEDTSVTLVILDKQVLAHVVIGGKTYAVTPVSGAVHRVTEVDGSKILPDVEMIVDPKFRPKAAAEPTTEAEPKAVTTSITMLIVRTANVEAVLGATQMSQLETQAVSLMNQALTKSKTTAKIVRVGGVTKVVYPDNTAAGNSISKSLCDVSGFTNRPEFGCTANNQAGKFKAVRNKRNTVKADVVVLMRLRQTGFQGFCGLAWLNENVTQADHPFGFAVAVAEDTFCISMHTVSHEVGHNMGLRHDRETTKEIDGNPTVFPNSQHNFGFISDPGTFYDIMAYQASCGNEGDPFDCNQLSSFSNPTVLEDGRPTGIAKGRPKAADAARTIREGKTAISQFR